MLQAVIANRSIYRCNSDVIRVDSLWNKMARPSAVANILLRTTSKRIRIPGKIDICFSSVERISDSVEDPVMFRSLLRPSDVTTWR